MSRSPGNWINDCSHLKNGHQLKIKWECQEQHNRDQPHHLSAEVQNSVYDPSLLICSFLFHLYLFSSFWHKNCTCSAELMLLAVIINCDSGPRNKPLHLKIKQPSVQHLVLLVLMSLPPAPTSSFLLCSGSFLPFIFFSKEDSDNRCPLLLLSKNTNKQGTSYLMASSGGCFSAVCFGPYNYKQIHLTTEFKTFSTA